MEETKARHKKEIKSFESDKRNALKKIKGTAGKGKKGKEALAAAEIEWAAQEKKMRDRHAEELDSIPAGKDEVVVEVISEPHETESGTQPTQPQLSAKEKALAKKARKREKEREKERAKEAAIAAEIANAGPSPRDIEIQRIMEMYLQPAGMRIEEVKADGNCLYRAVAEQLQKKENKAISYEQIRTICADTLDIYKEEYEPFADLSDHGVSTFEEYIEKVRKSSEWGGHLELRALATALKTTIIVYSADSSPLHIRVDKDNESSVDKEDEEGFIRLSFHRHYYALGEHYNSVGIAP